MRIINYALAAAGIVIILLLISCSPAEMNNSEKRLTQAYPFGADTIFDQPTLFAPGSISTMDYELNNQFNSDQTIIYYTKSTPGFNLMTMVSSEYRDGRWSPPKVLSFSGQYVDSDPYLSPDGSKMYFISKRPNPGETSDDFDIYVTERTDNEWSDPQRLEAPINSDQPDYYPAITNNGTLYLSTVREGGEGSFDLYRSNRNEDGSYGILENLGAAINSESAEIDVYVDPDEEYIIFVSYKSEGFGSGDLYVSFNKDGKWSEAENLGQPVNSSAREYTPLVTPDGRFLFYTSERSFADAPLDTTFTAEELQNRLRQAGNGLGDIYFIELSTLDAFKNR
jgi:Tol biopolymer transport system component